MPLMKRRWRRDGQESAPHSESVSNGGKEAALSNGDVSQRTHVSRSSSFFSDLSLSPVSFGILCACVVGVVFLCAVVILWFRSKRRRKKLLYDLTFDEGSEESKGTKSAPASRSPSPKLNKRMSCPDALGAQSARGIVVRSMTADRIPDFSLPPERVQPWNPKERSDSAHFSSSARQGQNAIGSIKPDLYHHQSFSEDDEPNLPETSHGRLWFSLFHDAGVGQLQVTLIKVKDIPGRSPTQQTRDPFVKMFLLPDERTYRMSKVKKKTLSPIYNETHSFEVSSEEVKNRVLRFSVYDVDRRRVRHSLGHVMINLKSFDLTKADAMCCDLEPMVQTATSLGELQFSLGYFPINDKVKVGIYKARNLHHVDENQDLGAFVRIQLFYGHKCHRVKRTVMRQVAADQVFNETLSFSIHGRQLEQCSMTISLMLSSPSLYGNADIEYGRMVIGPFMYARGDELMHWQEMMSQPNTATTRWHAFTPGTQSAP